MKTSLVILACTLFTALCDSCTSSTDPVGTSSASSIDVRFGGNVYGTAVVAHQTEPRQTGCSSSFQFIDTLRRYGYSPTVLNEELFHLTSRDPATSVTVALDIVSKGRGSIAAGDYDASRATLSIRNENDKPFESDNSNITKRRVHIDSVVGHSLVSGTFEMEWHYKYDTTRTAWMSGSFSIQF